MDNLEYFGEPVAKLIIIKSKNSEKELDVPSKKLKLKSLIDYSSTEEENDV